MQLTALHIPYLLLQCTSSVLSSCKAQTGLTHVSCLKPIYFNYDAPAGLMLACSLLSSPKV
jgi:hypothetical protein